MNWAKTRTARKPHRCERCKTRILPGERYVHYTLSPDDHEVGNVGWWDMKECAACAATHSRGDLAAGMADAL